MLGERTLALLILIVAAYFRLWRLDELPPGFHHDIGVNGLDVMDVLAGARPVFFERNFGREAFFIYLQAALVGAVGFRPMVFNFAGVAMSMLSVALTYRLFRDWFSASVALTGASLYGFSFWAVDIGRLGLRGSSVPAFMLLTILLLARLLRRRSGIGVAIATGIVLGASLYTYLAARLLPVLIAAAVVLAPTRARAAWRSLVVAAIAAAVVFLPLGQYFFEHRAELTRRAFDVSIANPNPDIEGTRNTATESLLNTLGMFTVRGDENVRHNVPARPVFTGPWALLFYGGLIVAAWSAPRAWRYRIALTWLALLLVPSALSHESPSMFRTFGAAPIAHLFPVLAIDAIARSWRRGSHVVWGVAAIGILIFAAETHRLYFDEWPRRSDIDLAFDGNLPRLARFVESRGEPILYLSVDRRPPVQVLSPRARDGRWYREESFAVPMARDASGDSLYVSGPGAALPDAAPMMLPGLRDLAPSIGPDGKPDFRAYVWTEADRRAFARDFVAIDAPMGNDFRLVGHRTRRLDAARLDVALLWQPLAPSGPYDLFVHARRGDGSGLGQADRLVWPIDGGPPRDDVLVTRQILEATGTDVAVLEIGVVKRDPLDRARLIGGPIGDVARIMIPP
ncbi:MAG: hypothetical protein EPO26_18820 [Chloroflexota bacterium]|nr:MAG: hypothetical protein EPO26_18820 [Chloroflexota bacterium]